MDIAIGGLLILFLLLPGISFNRGYYSQQFSRRYTDNDFFGLLINTIFPSIILYLAAWPIIYLFGFTYDFAIILNLISSVDELVKDAIEKINLFALSIIVFQFFLNLVAFFVGLILRNMYSPYQVHI